MLRAVLAGVLFVVVALAGCSDSRESVVVVADQRVCWSGEIHSQYDGVDWSESIEGCGTRGFDWPFGMTGVEVTKKGGALPVCIELREDELAVKSWCTTAPDDMGVELYP